MLKKILVTFLLLTFATQGFAKTKIVWWHAMEKDLGKVVTDMIRSFNASQEDYEIVEDFKGSYTDAMYQALDAFKEGKEYPHLVQVHVIGTMDMMSKPKVVYPLYDMIKDYDFKFDKSIYVPGVLSYYETDSGELASMPFNTSSTTMWYNKAAFVKAGIKEIPKTWNEVAEAGRKLRAIGFKCGFTTAHPSWILIENYSALNNIPVATLNNGYAGNNPKLLINSPAHINFWERLNEWSKDGTYSYSGQGGTNSKNRFIKEECGITFESSSGFATFNRRAKFRFGQALLPYDDQVTQKPQNTIIGGASLWVLRGHSKDAYAGIVEFFKYVSRPEVQAVWHEKTGYAPSTMESYDLTKNMRFYQKRLGTDSAYLEINLNKPTVNSKGLRLGEHQKIRNAIEKQLDLMLKGEKTAKQALDTAVRDGNAILDDFASRLEN